MSDDTYARNSPYPRTEGATNLIKTLLRVRRYPSRFWRYLTPLVGVLVGLCSAMRAAPVSEYEVKGAFLYNFIQFVQWPSGTFRDNEPFVIGVLGRDPFGPSLDALVAGETHEGRPFIVRRFEEMEDVGFCHVLFVSPLEKADLPKLLATVRDRPILTVGEADSFLASGGMVRFVLRDKRVRFQISAPAAKAAGLEISSKLLRLSER